MRVLVTGGGGFIGSHIVDQLLSAGHEAGVVDNFSTGNPQNLPAGIQVFEADIRDAERLAAAFDAFRPEAVCHQAAQVSVPESVRHPETDAAINVDGLLHVFSNAVRVGARRIVFASSGGVLYGEQSTPARENTTPAPISPYGITKLAGELYLEFFCREHDIEGIALRYSNVYGPRQNPHGEAGVVAIFSRRMLRGEPATVNGDGHYVRDYVFGPDVARANILALTSGSDLLPGRFTPLNIGTGRPCDVNELAESLRALVGEIRRSRGKNEVPPLQRGPARPGDLRSNLVDAARAETVLGWRPTVALEEGLRKTVAWFAENP